MIQMGLRYFHVQDSPLSDTTTRKSIMPPSLKIAIVGYGTAGQALAILLSRDGHQVEVFERAAEPGPEGAGFL